MAEEDDKIRYRDIIEPDDSIERLIKQLSDLNKSYETMVGAIRGGAEKIVHTIKSTSSATKEGQVVIDEAAAASNRLKRAQYELKLALSDTGKQIAWLKAKTADANRTTVEQQRYIRQAVDSYDRLKSDLKETVTLYKSLSAAERADSEMGQKLLANILNLKNQIKTLDDQMRPYINTLTEVEKAERRLAFLQSEEGQKLLDLKAKIAAVTAERRNQKAAIDPIAEAEKKLAQARSQENEILKGYNIQIKEANRIAQLNARIANSQEGSYNRLAAQYELNKIKLNAMSEAERTATESGKALVKETYEMYQQMIKLQEATGNHRLSVGHYEKQWNRLGFSVVQVVRELPAAAISLNTFFLGISNNLPMVIDEINRVRAQNKALAEEGKPTVSVAKSITKALLGWNTIMVAMLTVFSMHGNAIFKWIDRVLSGRSAVLSTTEAMESLNEELSKNARSYGSEVSVLRRLSDEWKRLGGNLKEQQQFIKDNQTEFGKLDVTINDVNTASTVFVDSTDDFIEALKARAKAQAALNILSEKTGELLEIENKAEAEKTKKYGFFDNATNYFKAIWAGFSGPDSDLSFAARLATQRQRNIKELNDDKDELQETVDSYFKVYQFYIDKTNDLYKKLGLEGKHKKDRTRKGPRMLDTEDTLESLSVAATKAYQESVTKLERDEIKKRRKESLEAYNVEVADLQRKYNKIQRIIDGQDVRYKKLTDEQKEQALKAQSDIARAIENKQKQLEQGLYLLSYTQQEKEAEKQLATLNLQIGAVKKGSEEELKLRLQILRVEEQIALARNKQLPPAQQQDESNIKASFKAKRTDLVTEFNTTDFNQQQALQEAQFNEVERSEREVTKFKLQQEKERWLYQIQLAEAGALDWSQVQIDAAKSTVIGIDRELFKLDDALARIDENGLGYTLLETLGFKDNQIDAFTNATSIILDQLQAILQAEVDLAEAALESANKRADAAKEALDAELEARNAGYANNVVTSRKELEQARQQQREKQRMLEEAQRNQQRLDSLMQASSLITASANIWSSLSKIPIVGPALAIAMIGTMWTSFAVAKVKAKQVTQAQSEEYGEGGYEVLEGGSHASGNDIDLGVNNSKKKRMRAEGGEGLAVINRRSTRKYSKVLPDIIESINKGSFEEKYIRAFAESDNILNLRNESVNVIDLSTTEEELKAIRKQGEVKYFQGANGSIIEIKGNVKRVIRE